MKRVALLTAVLFPIALLFYALHGNSKASATAAKPNERDVAPVATTPNAPPSLATSAANPSVVEHANIDGLPAALEPGYLAVEHAAKKCWRDRGRGPAPSSRPGGADETIESIQLTYRQVSVNGVGHIEDLKVAHGAFTDQALQSCIVKAGAAVTWSASQPDGAIGEFEHNVNIGDLMRPDVGPPPESQRRPTSLAPPPPELAKPLGQREETVEEKKQPDVIVSDPAPASIPKN